MLRLKKTTEQQNLLFCRSVESLTVIEWLPSPLPRLFTQLPPREFLLQDWYRYRYELMFGLSYRQALIGFVTDVSAFTLLQYPYLNV